MPEDVNEFLQRQLQDALSAERQALEGMESMLDVAAAASLKQAIEGHMAETRRQIERLEAVMERLGLESEGELCGGMQGLIDEAEEMIEAMEEGPLLDVALVAAAQKIEHYEIAAYGTLCALLKAAGHEEAAGSLARTLQEEKDTDERLSMLAEQEINPAALRGGAANGRPDRASSAA